MTARRVANAAVLLFLIALIAWELAGIGSTLVTGGHLADAGSYQAAVNRWLAGDSPYAAAQLSGPHSLGDAAGGVGFVYPPTALPLFLPLALGVDATLVWVLLTHAAFVVVVFVIARRELQALPIAGALGLVAVALALPGLEEIRFGNASALVASLLGLMWLLPRHAAAFAVLAGAIKVFPLLGVPWAKRWGGSLTSAAALGALLLALSLMVGPHRWIEWTTAMTTATPSCQDWALVSLSCATGSALPGLMLGGVLFIGALAAPTRSVSFLLLTVAMITPAPDLYQHYLLVPFIGAIPVGCQALSRAWAQLAARRATALTAAAA